MPADVDKGTSQAIQPKSEPPADFAITAPRAGLAAASAATVAVVTKEGSGGTEQWQQSSGMVPVHRLP